MTGRPGVDVPDGRGRIGLDRVGRDLTGNPGVVVRDVEVPRERLARAAPHHVRLPAADGRWTTQQRETYDRGNGATILLYDAAPADRPAHAAVPLPGVRQRPP